MAIEPPVPPGHIDRLLSSTDTKGRKPSDRPPCAICGQGPHRYGTTDPEHKYDAMGCVNMLIPLLRELVEAVEQSELNIYDGMTWPPLLARARRAWRD